MSRNPRLFRVEKIVGQRFYAHNQSPMDTEQKYTRIIRSLSIPYENIFSFPDRVLSLEPCFMSPDTPDNTVLVPLEANVQLANVLLRTRRIDEVDSFIKAHGTDALPQHLDTTIDAMLAKISEFEVVVPVASNVPSDVAEDELKAKILARC